MRLHFFHLLKIFLRFFSSLSVSRKIPLKTSIKSPFLKTLLVMLSLSPTRSCDVSRDKPPKSLFLFLETRLCFCGSRPVSRPVSGVSFSRDTSRVSLILETYLRPVARDLSRDTSRVSLFSRRVSSVSISRETSRVSLFLERCLECLYFLRRVSNVSIFRDKSRVSQFLRHVSSVSLSWDTSHVSLFFETCFECLYFSRRVSSVSISQDVSRMFLSFETSLECLNFLRHVSGVSIFRDKSRVSLFLETCLECFYFSRRVSDVSISLIHHSPDASRDASRTIVTVS